jgi:hypothetical protein
MSPCPCHLRTAQHIHTSIRAKSRKPDSRQIQTLVRRRHTPNQNIPTRTCMQTADTVYSAQNRLKKKIPPMMNSPSRARSSYHPSSVLVARTRATGTATCPNAAASSRVPVCVCVCVCVCMAQLPKVERKRSRSRESTLGWLLGRAKEALLWHHLLPSPVPTTVRLPSPNQRRSLECQMTRSIWEYRSPSPLQS